MKMRWVIYPTGIIHLTNYINIECFTMPFFNELAKGDIKVCKSHKHHDGEECFGGGWFIVMAELPTGQISNHYENQYWELFNIPELDTAWEWDGHTPNEAADRICPYPQSTQ